MSNPESAGPPLMPYSPLDALVDALPAVRKAGRVNPGDTCGTVDGRIADVFLPIVKRIQQEAHNAAIEEAAEMFQQDFREDANLEITTITAAIRELKK